MHLYSVELELSVGFDLIQVCMPAETNGHENQLNFLAETTEKKKTWPHRRDPVRDLYALRKKSLIYGLCASLLRFIR